MEKIINGIDYSYEINNIAFVDDYLIEKLSKNKLTKKDRDLLIEAVNIISNIAREV